MLLSDLFAHPSRVAAHPIFKDACAIWDFNRETGDRVFDKSVVDRPYHGTFAGTGSNPVRRVVTPYGPGIDNPSDNANRRIDLGSITSSDLLSGNPTGEISVFSFLLFDDDSSNRYPRIIDKSSGGGAANGWSFNFEGATSSKTDVEFNVGGTFLNEPHGLSTGAWASMAVSGKTGVQKVYANGANVGATGTASITFPSTTTNAALLNWNHTTDRQCIYPFSLIAVWPRILSDAEHYALYQEAITRQFKATAPIRFPIPTAGGGPSWDNTINEILSPGAVNEITNANIQSVNEI